jgi:hypothetical protein
MFGVTTFFFPKEEHILLFKESNLFNLTKYIENNINIVSLNKFIIIINQLRVFFCIERSPFASLISRIFSTSQPCFSLIINQLRVISVMTFQTNKHIKFN